MMTPNEAFDRAAQASAAYLEAANDPEARPVSPEWVRNEMLTFANALIDERDTEATGVVDELAPVRAAMTAWASAEGDDHQRARAARRAMLAEQMPRFNLATFKPTPTVPIIWKASEYGDVAPRSSAIVLGAGTTGIISGPGGSGKSSLTYQIALEAAGASAGLSKLGMEVAPGRVLLVSLEDTANLVAYRLQRMAEQHPGASDVLGKIDLIGCGEAGPLWHGGEGRSDTPGPSADWGLVASHVRDIGSDLSLLVIDPALSAMSAGSNDAAAVRGLFRSLASLMEDVRAACLIVAHSTKMNRSMGDAPGSVSGSAAWHDAARCVFVLAPAPTNPDEPPVGPPPLRLRLVKNNLGSLRQPCKADLTIDVGRDGTSAGLAPIRTAPRPVQSSNRRDYE